MYFLNGLFYYVIIYYLIDITGSSDSLPSSRPHIIFILVDDLGWNDVGFHGSNQIPTPNIDALGYYGLILNNYYVNYMCTPSRSALMTGRHPIHNGMQHFVLLPIESRGLPLNETLLPEHLKKLGYATHAIGKWNLGHYKKEYTPLYRGFDSHLGFWSPGQDYFDHTYFEDSVWGYDMRRGMEPAWDLHGQYSTDVFTQEAVNIINKHNTSQPLFMYLAHAAVHWGNYYNTIPALDEEVAKFLYIPDYNRSRYAGVLSRLDNSVGKVVEALNSTNMLNNSIIVLCTDNGGPTAGYNMTSASNWPLRGSKETLWEGGVRGAAVIWSNLLSQPSKVYNETIHITDWLPTLYHAAGGNMTELGSIDGVDAWDALVNNTKSARKDILHNIDWIDGCSALTVGKWKIINGTSRNRNANDWYGPSGREDPTLKYDINGILNSSTGIALAAQRRSLSSTDIEKLRSEAEVKCNFDAEQFNDVEQLPPCEPEKAPCLFNIEADPCEKHNLALRRPDVLAALQHVLSLYNNTVVPPSNLPNDPRSNPQLWDHLWTNYGDYE